MRSITRLSLVLPAYNEEQAIAETIQDARQVLEAMDLEAWEIIVVDDGSSDRTAEFAERHGARIVRHPLNAGYGRSLKDGIAAAEHDTIIIADADGTYPLEAIPSLLKQYSRGMDMVVGARSGDHYRESWLKGSLRVILRLLVEFTTGQRIPDINSGLRVFSRASVTQYFDALCNTFSFSTSLTLAYLMTGRFVAYAPIDYRARIGEKKVRMLRDTLRTLQFIVEAVTYYNPIKIFLVICVGLLAFTCLGAATAILAGSGLAPVIGVAGTIAAILVFALGLHAVLLSRMLHWRRSAMTSIKPPEHHARSERA